MLTGRVKNSDFAFILDKINNRIAGWKGKLLSRAGRVTLAKSVIAAVPSYTMQNLWFSEGVCDKIDASVRDFIWGRKNCHWVNWNSMTKHRNRGGLGIRIARQSNIALLGKHVWDILHSPNKLWVNLMSSKYLQNSHILSIEPHPGDSYIWRSILKAVDFLKGGFRFRVGKGELSFWYDNWLEEGHLCNLVPFVHINDVQLSLRDIYRNGAWNFASLSTMIPIEIQLKIKSVFLNDAANDIIIWAASTDGVYSAQSAYRWMDDNCTPVHPNMDHWGWVWKLQVTENIRHLVWLTMCGSLPTNFTRFNHHVTTDSSCQRCGAIQESILHALKDCPEAKRIWEALQLFHLFDPAISDVTVWVQKNSMADYGVTFILTCWFIWRSRAHLVNYQQD